MFANPNADGIDVKISIATAIITAFFFILLPSKYLQY
jgi:hypothetical protein